MAVFGDNNIIKVQTYGSGYGTAQAVTGTSGYHTFNYGQTGFTGDRQSGNNSVMSFTKLSSTSDLKIVLNMPSYIATGGSGVGIRLQYSLDSGSNFFTDTNEGNGPADYWGATGYGGNTSDIIRMEYNSQFTDADQSVNIYGHTGTVLFQHQFYVASTDTFYPNTYNSSYYKYSTTQCYEIQR